VTVKGRKSNALFREDWIFSWEDGRKRLTPNYQRGVSVLDAGMVEVVQPRSGLANRLETKRITDDSQKKGEVQK